MSDLLEPGFVVTKNDEQSKEIQSELFKRGYGWGSDYIQLLRLNRKIIIFRNRILSHAEALPYVKNLLNEGLRQYMVNEILYPHLFESSNQGDAEYFWGKTTSSEDPILKPAFIDSDGDTLYMSDDENTIRFKDCICIAKESCNGESCRGCFFYRYKFCNYIKCALGERKDGRAVYFVLVDKINSLDTKDQVIPLREHVYGRDTHVALMKAHRQREERGRYEAFARQYGDIINKTVRGLTQTTEARTDGPQDEKEK